MSEIVNCELCGEPMPKGEEMFKYHGYSGRPCPKPAAPTEAEVAAQEDDNDRSKDVRNGFICAEWRQFSEGPILDFETMRRRQVVVRCDRPDGHKGDHVDSVVLVNWKNEPKSEVSAVRDAAPDCVNDVRYRTERISGIHVAECSCGWFWESNNYALTREAGEKHTRDAAIEGKQDGNQVLPALDVTREEHAAACKNLQGESVGSVLYCIMLHERKACRERQLSEALSEVNRLTADVEVWKGNYERMKGLALEAQEALARERELVSKIVELMDAPVTEDEWLMAHDKPEMWRNEPSRNLGIAIGRRLIVNRATKSRALLEPEASS